MIELKNVSFTYKASQDENNVALVHSRPAALHNVDLSFQTGEVVLITGFSGCGKSTILRLINGLIPHYYSGELSGEVKVDGFVIKNTTLKTLANKIGSVFQNPKSQFFNGEAYSELAFACENLSVPPSEIEKRISETVKRFSIENLINRSLFKMSGGEKQRIACASVDTPRPDILLLDEPTANLDYNSTMQLRQIIELWKGMGKTIIVAEHRIGWIWDLLDRTVIMKDGSIIECLDRASMNKMTDEKMAEKGLRSIKMEDPILLTSSDFKKSGLAEPSSGTTDLFSLKDLLTIKNLSFQYTKKSSLLELNDLQFSQNEISAIVGKNGLGKTTFLRCLCGIQKHCKGKAILDGVEYKIGGRGKKSIGGKCFMVMQDVNHQLFTESVLDEVLISMEDEDEKLALEILEKLDLSELKDVHPMALSGGQKQRVAIACAVASKCPILLFDEPTSGLDYNHMLMVAEILKNLQNEGRMIIIVTHDSELIHTCCTNVVHLTPLG